MRIKLVFLIAFTTMLQVSASSFAQKINISKTNISLEQALKLIRQQSGYDILFDASVVRKPVTLDLNIKNETLSDALKQCLEGQNLTYTIKENTVLIKEKTLIQNLKDQLTFQFAAVDIKGYVFAGKNREPLAGATVVVKRTKKSVFTNNKGQFSLIDVLPSDTLVCSYIGYVTKVVGVGKETNFYLMMDETTNGLDAVVVQGYGKTTQRTTTGNIVRISAEEIGKQLIENPLLALQGAVTGLEVSNVDGHVAGVQKVELRGRKSINGNLSSEPLYIVDGVPLTVLQEVRAGSGGGSESTVYPGLGISSVTGNSGINPLYSIDPNSIESIEVLKDADATAIYGSRGGNGVILITTKKGKPGKTSLEAKVQQGVRMVIRDWDLLNTQQYLEMRRESFKNDKTTPNITNAPELLRYDQNRYTNWQDYAYGGTGRWSTYDGALSGGTTQTSFRLAGSLNRTKDITTLEGLNQRISTTASLVHASLDQRLKLQFNANYGATENNSINSGFANLMPPNGPEVLDAKGDLNFAEWQTVMAAFAGRKKPISTNGEMLNAGLNLAYNVFKNFNFNLNVGYNKTNSSSKLITPLGSYNLSLVRNAEASMSTGQRNVKNFIVEPQAVYDTFIGQGRLNVLLGGSFQNNKSSMQTNRASGFASDELLGSIGNGTKFTSTEEQLQYKYVGVFARLNYNWRDKYILNLNARRDGSSRFGPANRFGNFGSIGAAWIVSQEEWLNKHLPKAISFIKLRGSIGVTGTDAIGDYKYLPQWGTNVDAGKLPNYDGVAAWAPQLQPNDKFHWQRNKKTEFGLSLAFFKDNLSVDVNRYSDFTDNQLLTFPSPNYTGFSNLIFNSPAEVRNSGLEISINGKLMAGKKFSWNAGFNFSKNQNKLVDYPDFKNSPYYNIYKIGQSLSTIYAYKSLGVNPETGEYEFYDFDGDGKIGFVQNVPPGTMGDDRGVFIDTAPAFFGGMNQSFRFKNISLSALFYYSKRKTRFTSLPTGNNNMQVYVYENSWRKPGDIAQYSKFTNLVKNTNTYFSSTDANYVKADFLRLKTLQLSYSLAPELLKSIGISALSVNVTGQNIFVISNFKGPDPEISDFHGMPQTRTITMGLNCSF